LTPEQLQVIKELTITATGKMNFPSSLDLREYNSGVITEICKAFQMISKTVLESTNPEK